ncbi:MAG: CsbD family protein [Acidobacteria bacterium]|nr:CsbD family protein [Acidobacteriota bacterium]
MGNMDQAKGKIKQAAGDLTDDEDLEREGKVDELAGDVKDKASDAVDRVKDALHKS